MPTQTPYAPPDTPDTEDETADTCPLCGETFAPGDLRITTDDGEICEECDRESEHCANCGNRVSSLDDLTEDCDGEWNCADCTRASYGRTTCDQCDRPASRWDLNVTASGLDICPSCASDMWGCDSCGDLIADGDYCESCEEGRDDDDDEQCECYGCRQARGSYGPSLINSYSYRPVPVFHGDGPVFLGFELEIRTAHRDPSAELAVRHLGDLGYLKEDGSIGYGFEIVTHPMSHAFAVESFPWTMLDALAADRCEADRHGLGLHVHVSRAGFDGPGHVLRWLRLLHRNSRAVARIARRDSSEWAAWTRESARAAKDHAKGSQSGHRYTAINVQNDATFEVRVFRSTLNRDELRAALDLVDASVEYTRDLTVRAVVDGGWSWDAFTEWVGERPQYAALHAMMTSENARA